jgi:uncharacterized protein YutE (UPF0331/DUF86 family)
MVDREVLLGKLATLERCLARIADVRGPRRASLLPIDVDDITVINLQRAAQAAIDVASHVVMAENYGIPDSLSAPFELLERHGVLDAGLAWKLRKIIGLRSITLHDRPSTEPALADAIVNNRMGDFRAFAARLLARFGGE